MLELGVFIELTEIVTVLDARLERILRRARWPSARWGKLVLSETPKPLLDTWRSRPMP
ncbi:hypothetical protein [Bradyrhizobium sp. CW1]|uniref:hypothetical protein n=1 Tax=Bradyrhizobium sp. CW1 TaxID=2782686 RepID=UPI00320A9C19